MIVTNGIHLAILNQDKNCFPGLFSQRKTIILKNIIILIRKFNQCNLIKNNNNAFIV